MSHTYPFNFKGLTYFWPHYRGPVNKGYGAKKHIEGIKTHGITEWHRKTFGICKNSPITL